MGFIVLFELGILDELLAAFPDFAGCIVRENGTDWADEVSFGSSMVNRSSYQA